MRRGRVVILLILAVSLLDAGVAYAANFVTVKAWASEEYLKERARDPNKKVQTYQFAKGTHFKGKSADKSLEAMTFDQLVLDLAQHLVKQDFYPNPAKGEGDLLIVVHYGVTDFEEDMFELLGIANESELLGMDVSGTDITVGNIADNAAFLDVMDTLAATQSMTQTLNTGGNMTRQQKAHLLGIDDQFDKPSHLNSDYEYEQMLREARYFVVLMAFDYQHFRQKDEAKLLWSTRYNIRSAGQNFETAIQEMNEIGSNYFGKNFDKLMRKRRDDKTSVEIGEIEVIENDVPAADSNQQTP